MKCFRTGPGPGEMGGLEGAYPGTVHPLWLTVGACDHPGFEDKGSLPMAVGTPVLDLRFGFILDFGKDASNL